MGFIRNSLIFLLGSLLFLTIFSGSIFLTLGSSLKYEKIQPQLASISKNLITGNLISEEVNLDEILEEKTEIIKEYCQNNSEYVFSYEDYTFVIPCSIANQSSEEIIDYGINYLVNKTYYKDYECNFFDCFEKEPLFLISEKAKDYWMNKFYLTLVASLILIMIMFLLLKKKSNLPIIVGSTLIISAIPLMKFKDVIASLVNILLPVKTNTINIQITDIIMIFFSEARNVAIKMIIIGGVIFGLGIILKILARFKKPEIMKGKIKKKEIKPQKQKNKSK